LLRGKVNEQAARVRYLLRGGKPFSALGNIDNEKMENYLKMSDEVNKIIERSDEKNDFPSRPSVLRPVAPIAPKSNGKTF